VGFAERAAQTGTTSIVYGLGFSAFIGIRAFSRATLSTSNAEMVIWPGAMDRRSIRWIVVNIVVPPLQLLSFILKPIGFLLGLLLDRPFARRDQKKFRLDIAEAMPFLFQELHARIVPNEGVPFPPGFDYAFVTVEIENMLIRFCRGRGELDVHVGSRARPRDLHELGLVLSLLDKECGVKRWGIMNLRDAAQVLESHIDLLKRALGGDAPNEALMRCLAQVAASDRIAIREAEWEINKPLRSRWE